MDIKPTIDSNIEEARKEIRDGKCTICKTEKELKDFLETL